MMCVKSLRRVFVYLFFAFAEAARQMAARLFCSFVCYDRSIHYLSVFAQAAGFIFYFFLNLYSVAIGITSDPGAHLENGSEAVRLV